MIGLASDAKYPSQVITMIRLGLKLDSSQKADRVLTRKNGVQAATNIMNMMMSTFWALRSLSTRLLLVVEHVIDMPLLALEPVLAFENLT